MATTAYIHCLQVFCAVTANIPAIAAHIIVDIVDGARLNFKRPSSEHSK
ncbi:hypothetical protein ABIE50_002705 [Chitinophaga sp. OAE865]